MSILSSTGSSSSPATDQSSSSGSGSKVLSLYPFLPVLMGAIDGAGRGGGNLQASMLERRYLSHLVTQSATAAQCRQMGAVEVLSSLKGQAELQPADADKLAALRKQCEEFERGLPLAMSRAGVHPALPDPAAEESEGALPTDGGGSLGNSGGGERGGAGTSNPPGQPLTPDDMYFGSEGSHGGEEGKGNLGSKGVKASTLSLRGFEPAFVRPVPPMMEVAESEVIWLHPTYAPRYLWDSGMCQDHSKGAAVRELVAKAFKAPLLPAQMQQVLSELQADR
jgi:hypothetical protein